jgi:putative ABC transport system permease protein
MFKLTVGGMAARKLRLALTGLAIVVGVTFISGTLILTDTLNRTFNNLVGTAYQHTTFEVRGKAAFSNSNAAVNPTAERRPLPQSLASVIAHVKGVAYVYGSVGGYAQYMTRDDNAIGSGGTSTLGFSFDPNPQLSPYRLIAGQAPTGPDDVVIDKATASKYGFGLGDRVLINLPQRPRTFTVSGIVTFGNDDNLVGVTLAGFSLATAQALFDSPGHYETISILAAPHADTVALQRLIARIVPAGVEVVSGQTVASELSSAVDNSLSFISTTLLIFAFIAMFVGAFTIFNTFSITVGQRSRELALLRVIGAGRGQVFGSVLGEAALVGLASSLIGLGLGAVAAIALKALLRAFGTVLPPSPLVFEARTVLAALAVGIGVTVLSAILPAHRAVRIAPVAALSDHQETAPAPLRRRRIAAGVVIALLGAASVARGVGVPSAALVGAGAAALFVATLVLVSLVARPLAGVLGRPLAAGLGIAGRLGRENSMRSPRRTAQTAAALMVGMAVVSAIGVLGDSLATSAKRSVDSAINADYLVSGNGGFSRSVLTAVSGLPGVRTATAVYQGQFEFHGSLSKLVAATPAHLSDTVNLHVESGTAGSALAAGELLIDSTTAARKELHVGSVVAVRFALTGSTLIRIGGVFKPNPLVGSFVVGDSYFISHFDHPLPTAVLLSSAGGASGLAAALDRTLVPYANVGFKSRAQFEAAQQHSVNQELGLVYVLLALAVLVALTGIVNTLLLSVFERTREIGLLRAVGMARRQVRTMIRSEAVIVALFGAVIGLVLGSAVGIALARSLRQNGVTDVAIPTASVIAFLVLSALLGLIAASWPARRAARLDVLASIASQ